MSWQLYGSLMLFIGRRGEFIDNTTHEIIEIWIAVVCDEIVNVLKMWRVRTKVIN